MSLRYGFNLLGMFCQKKMEAGDRRIVGCFPEDSFQSVPHETCLAWLEDVLTVCDRHGWGWAQWNLDCKFGIMDTNRPGGQYEDFCGHRLERAVLELLRRHLPAKVS